MRLEVDIPISLDDSQESKIEALIEQYHQDNPATDWSQEQVNELIRTYLLENPIQGNSPLLNGDLTRFSKAASAADLTENFIEHDLPELVESTTAIASLDGYIYLIPTSFARVYVFNPNTKTIDEIINTGFQLDGRSYIYNPIYHKIYGIERYSGDLLVYDIVQKTATRHTSQRVRLVNNGEYYGGAIHSIDYTSIYFIPTRYNEMVKWNLARVENDNITDTDSSFLLPTTKQYALRDGRMGRNGVIYIGGYEHGQIVTIDTMNNDTGNLPIIAGFGLSSGRAFFDKFAISGDGRYIMMSRSFPTAYLGYIGGRYIRIDTEDNSMIWDEFPLDYYGNTNYWSLIGGFGTGIDGNIYVTPYRNVPGNTVAHIYGIDNNTPTVKIENAVNSNGGYSDVVTALNGKMYSFQRYSPYVKVLEIYPIGEKKYDPKKLMLAR